MRRRVRIIGAGIAGLTAAYQLSRTPAARARWDVEVLEMGHRFGGRLASAHHPEASGRNEEHGLHVWFGFYDNTFRLAEDVWRDAPRPAACPWSSIWDGLRPVFSSDHGLVDADDKYVVRRVHHPRNSDRPGGASATRSLTAHLTSVLDTFRAAPGTLLSLLADRTIPDPAVGDAVSRTLWPSPSPQKETLIREVDAALGGIAAYLTTLLVPAAPKRAALGERVHRALSHLHQPIVARALAIAGRDPGAIALSHTLDIALAVARGITSSEHGILIDGDFDRISQWELRTWLAHHGAGADTLARSRLLDALYDIPFAFLEGDRNRPVMEASTALRYTIRLLFHYKHAVAYTLTAGAGETLVAPLYRLLCSRRVRFRPFCRLESLRIDPSSRRLAAATFIRAARTKGAYDPLIERRGFSSLRAAPDWSQLEEGEALRRREVDFYSRFGDRGEEGRIELRVDRDFDDLVLALPLGCIKPDGDGKSPVGAWLAFHPGAQRALGKLHLVPTVAAQLWFREEPEAIGLRGRSVVTWGAPYSVACDMSPVIAHEDWDEPRPRSCVYLCGAWPLSAHRAPSSDRSARDADFAEARRALEAQMDRHGASLLDPKPTLHDAVGCAKPIDSQLVRANVEPWDLADLPLPGADLVRLEANDTGLSNLALAGAWVRTPVNTTSVEAAVASGIAAARALGAEVEPILGETFFRKPPEHTALIDREEPAHVSLTTDPEEPLRRRAS